SPSDTASGSCAVRPLLPTDWFRRPAPSSPGGRDVRPHWRHGAGIGHPVNTRTSGTLLIWAFVCLAAAARVAGAADAATAVPRIVVDDQPPGAAARALDAAGTVSIPIAVRVSDPA